MPALNSDNYSSSKSLSHISNRGVGKVNLFNDQNDYNTFIGYLKEYISPPPNPEETKKTFSINGRTFKGVPHQPKNYYNKIEVLAYSLLPNHFHLIINEVEKGSIEKLIRSLSTRYAIYYNKKYQRHGSLFAGPYKSTTPSNAYELTVLSQYLHHESFNQNGLSSYEDYIGARSDTWVKPNVVLSYLEDYENGEFRDGKGYKKFVEQHTLTQEEEQMLKSLVIDKLTVKTEDKVIPQPTEVLVPEPAPAIAVAEPEPRQRVPEFFAISTMVFIMLFAFGYRNVTKSAEEKTIQITTLPTPSPQVAGSETSNLEKSLPSATIIPTIEPTSTLLPSPTPTSLENNPITSSKSNPITYVVIKIEDDSASVNLRKAPSTDSEIVDQAFDGQKYELVAQSAEWYAIKLTNGSIAYVSVNYAQVEEGSRL